MEGNLCVGSEGIVTRIKPMMILTTLFRNVSFAITATKAMSSLMKRATPMRLPVSCRSVAQVQSYNESFLIGWQNILETRHEQDIARSRTATYHPEIQSTSAKSS